MKFEVKKKIMMQKKNIVTMLSKCKKKNSSPVFFVYLLFLSSVASAVLFPFIHATTFDDMSNESSAWNDLVVKIAQTRAHTHSNIDRAANNWQQFTL